MIGLSYTSYRHSEIFFNRYFITKALNIIKIQSVKLNPDTLKAGFGQLNHWRTNIVLVPNLYIELVLRRLPCKYTNFFTLSVDKKFIRLETTYA